MTQSPTRAELMAMLRALVFWCEALQTHKIINPQSTFWETIDKGKAMLAKADRKEKP